MFVLKVPCGQFVAAALWAGNTAGFEGAVLLLARDLGEGCEAELRRHWADLDDMTHDDFLVLFTGPDAVTLKNGILSYGIQRNVYAEGVSVNHPWNKRCSSEFEELLEVAHPATTPPAGEASKARLISPHGITDIRRSLGITEDDLPVLFVASVEVKQEPSAVG